MESIYGRHGSLESVLRHSRNQEDGVTFEEDLGRRSEIGKKQAETTISEVVVNGPLSRESRLPIPERASAPESGLSPDEPPLVEGAPSEEPSV